MSDKAAHIICLRFSSLGDVLLQSSVFSMLKSQYGSNVRLTLMTAGEFSPLLDGHPHIDNILSFSRKSSLKEIFKIFSDYHQTESVDFIFDLHNTVRANLLKLRFWTIPKVAVDKRKLERKLLVSPIKLRLLKNESIMTRVLKDFNFLWVKNFSKKDLSEYIFPDRSIKALSSLPSVFDSADRNSTLEKFDLHRQKFIALIPSASYATKRWPVDRYLELAKRLSQENQVVILAGPDDDFCSVFEGMDNIVNLQGKTSFKESSEIVGDALLCIGNDTGLIHMAEAQLVQCLMIMGPTSEAFGFATHLKGSHTFSHKLWCRPCSTNGSKDCFRDQVHCLNLTNVDQVFSMAKERLR